MHEYNKGWIKLPRDFIQSHLWLESTPEQKTVLITLLTIVNYKEKEWEFKGERFTCQPGQTITSLESIAKRCGKGISIQNVRTALKRFEKLGFLTNKSTNHNRLITICGWEHYQNGEAFANKPSNKQLTYDSQSPHRRLTATKKDKNTENKENSDVLPANAFDQFKR